MDSAPGSRLRKLVLTADASMCKSPGIERTDPRELGRPASWQCTHGRSRRNKVLGFKLGADGRGPRENMGGERADRRRKRTTLGLIITQQIRDRSLFLDANIF